MKIHQQTTHHTLLIHVITPPDKSHHFNGECCDYLTLPLNLTRDLKKLIGSAKYKTIRTWKGPTPKKKIFWMVTTARGQQSLPETEKRGWRGVRNVWSSDYSCRLTLALFPLLKLFVISVPFENWSISQPNKNFLPIFPPTLPFWLLHGKP